MPHFENGKQLEMSFRTNISRKLAIVIMTYTTEIMQKNVYTEMDCVTV